MDKNEAKRLSLQLMESAWAAYLTTIDEKGFPQTRAVDNLRSKERFPKLAEVFKKHDDFWTLISTNTSSAKLGQIEKNPAVSVYYCEPRNFRGLMLGGLIEVATNPDVKRAIWHDDWVRYYPKGINDADFTVLSLHPTEAKYYHQLNRFHFTFEGKTPRS